MSAVLHSTTDPREPLARARRLELFRFAREKGVAEIEETMPADLMRQILRTKGLTSIAVPDRPLGGVEQTITTPTSHNAGPSAPRQPDVLVEVDATADLARQWAAEKAVANMTITEMRKECKRRGIKLARTDNMVTLKAKLNG